MEDRQVVAAGFVLCVAGVALLIVPGVGSAGLPTLLATLLVVTVVSVGLLVAVSSVTDSEGTSIRLPSPERRPRFRRPGQAIADRLESVTLAGRRALAGELEAIDDEEIPRELLYADLYDLAIDVLTRSSGCREAEAADQLADGTWTDDPEAAAFFTEGLTPSLSGRQWISGGSGPTLPTVQRAQHVIAELTDIAIGDTVDPIHRTTNRSVETAYWVTDSLPATQSTGRIRQLTTAVLVLSGIGVLFGYPGLILVATTGIALAAAAKFASPTVSVTLAREVCPAQPSPGDEVTVTVTVHNDGERTLADLRVLDGVPPGLEVVEGSPRFSTALRPGKAATFTYTVEAVEGTHQFEPAIAIASDFFGTTERLEPVRADDHPTELSCGFDAGFDTIGALHPKVTGQSGLVEGDASGAGVEFDAVREYRPGDPLSRIDWHHRAKTGELSTVTFQEPRQPRVVLVVDARTEAYVAPAESDLPAPRHSARAAAAVGTGLLSNVVPVGLATTGTDCWLSPDCGTDQETELRNRLAGTDAVPWTPPADSMAVEDAVATLDARLAPNAQVVVFSPLTDDGGLDLCRRLDATGYPVTVVSPDCTDSASVDGAYGCLERWIRCSKLRNTGVPVYDWQPTDPVSEALKAHRPTGGGVRP